MADTTFSLHFRGWKDRNKIRNVKYEIENEATLLDRPVYTFEIYYSKENKKDRFTFYDSHANWKVQKQNLTEQDLFYAIMSRLQDAEDIINNPTLCDFIQMFEYTDCCEGIKVYKACLKAKEELVKIWGSTDNIIKAVEELRAIEDYL